ncbi:polysaccharide deacetylase family protein [Sarocladium strictum]
MLFTSALGALSCLLLGATASPVDLEKRQQPPAVPPYVAQGVAIYSCTKPNTVALTFDDGIVTGLAEKVITLLNNAGMKGTFFVNGQNWEYLGNHKATLQRMLSSNHQIGSHTYSHPHLPELNREGIKAEMIDLENLMVDLIGRYPTYMRPPYFEFNNEVLSVAKGLKYRVIITDLDTNDWKNDPAASLRDFKTGLDQKKTIVLAHDVHASTVNTLLPNMIAELKRRGMKSVTVGECLGEHPNNWYRWGKRN